MKSLALNLLGNAADAEDAVQEAFLRAYRGRQAFREGSALFTWVTRILINTCYDVGRRRVRRSGDTSIEADERIDPPAAASDQPLRLTLERALTQLAPIHREVFLLFDVEGYTHREIAEILTIPEGTSKARLFEARRQLRLVIGRPEVTP